MPLPPPKPPAAFYDAYGVVVASKTVLKSALEDESSSFTSSSFLTVYSVIGCDSVVVRSVHLITKSLINVSVS